MSEEARFRKNRSIAILKAEGVPYIEHLPVIPTESESKRRTVQEVAERAMAVCIAAVKGEGLEQEIVERVVQQYQLAPVFSPQEAAFIQDADPEQHDRVKFGWRYECYWVLLWALSYVDQLDSPVHICDVRHAVSLLHARDRDGFIGDARLRAQSEILDAADRIYRYHWAVVDARLKNQDPPAGLDPGVVMERHYVLNWLIGYMDQDWDDISTDT